MSEDNGKRKRRLIRDMTWDQQPIGRLQLRGPRSLSDAELLALMLGTPDALDLAQDILDRIGGLKNLTRHTLPELMEIEGIGKQLAGRLRAVAEVGRRLTSWTYKEAMQVSSPADAANLLMNEMADLEVEHLRVIVLGARNQVLEVPTIYVGSVNSALVRVGEVFRPAVKRNALSIIVVHNHPSGDPLPSPEDVVLTRQMVKAGKALDIELLDHVVIGRGRYISLRERGLGFE